MYKISIVEDNPKISEELTKLLSRNGYICNAVENFEHVCDEVINQNPHILLLDINLPMYDGYYVLREIREKSNMPVIIVTSRNSDMDELMGMNLGADDFITKPYNHNILLARIARIIDRVYTTHNGRTYTYNQLEYDVSMLVVTYEDNKVELTKNEGRILECLMQNSKDIVSRDELMEFLWQSNEFVDDNTLTVNINRLRNKLKDIGVEEFILTKRGKGYTLK